MKAAVFPDPVGAQHNTSLFYKESNSKFSTTNNLITKHICNNFVN